jgi:hypothetical protein
VVHSNCVDTASGLLDTICQPIAQIWWQLLVNTHAQLRRLTRGGRLRAMGDGLGFHLYIHSATRGHWMGARTLCHEAETTARRCSRTH